jgi:hypothetical protein
MRQRATEPDRNETVASGDASTQGSRWSFSYGYAAWRFS